MKQILIAFLFSLPVYCSLTFENPLNREGNMEVKRFFVMGERCSGTNFVSQLIEKNFPTLSQTIAYGHKHFLWWYEAPEDKVKLEKLGYTSLDGSEDCLFIFVVRSPYEWLRSFYATPHHVHPVLLGGSFYHFISHTWRYSEPNLPDHEVYELIDGLNPFTHRPFKNVCELRTYKIRNSLKLGSLVKNFLIVPYEKVSKNPKGLIRYIASHYSLAPSEKYIPITTYKGEKEKPFQKKKYSSIKKDSLRFINENLDWELERQLGYKAKTPGRS